MRKWGRNLSDCESDLLQVTSADAIPALTKAGDDLSKVNDQIMDQKSIFEFIQTAAAGVSERGLVALLEEVRIYGEHRSVLDITRTLKFAVPPEPRNLRFISLFS